MAKICSLVAVMVGVKLFLGYGLPAFAAGQKSGVSRRLPVAGLLTAILPSAASADTPIVFDYRTTDQIDTSAKKVVGDLSKPEVQDAISNLKQRRANAEGALQKLQADPLANVAADLGLPSEADTFGNAMKSKNIEGPLAAAVKDLRTWVKTISGVMDSKTQADTDRAGRIMITAWYKLAYDANFQPMPSEQTDLTGYYVASAKRKEAATVAKSSAEISDYVKALDFFIKFAE